MDQKILEVIIQSKKLKYSKWNTESKTDFIKLLHGYELSGMLPEIEKLNESQKHAIYNCLKKKFTLVQGPPGTGKTKTSSLIVKSWVPIQKIINHEQQKQAITNQNYDINNEVFYKILVTADSNKAVDNICLQLIKQGVKVVRVASIKSKIDMDPIVAEVLHENDKEDEQEFIKQELKAKNKLAEAEKKQKIKELVQKNDDGSLEDILNSKWKLEEINKIDSLNPQEMYIKTRELMKERMLKRVKNADVIAATLQVASVIESDFGINAKFVCILIDEATQTNEFKTFFSISKDCQRLALIGDHKQLGPVLPEKAEKQGYNSLFEQMVTKGQKLIQLDTQYRMHPKIAFNSSELFYQGDLKNGIGEKERMLYKNFIGSLFMKDDPRMYVNVKDGQEVYEDQSYYNLEEVRQVTNCINYIFEYYKYSTENLPEIGVIANYRPQVQKLKESIDIPYNFENNVQIDSVDAFQGREVDIVIISTVRANKDKKVGFIKDSRRMNVAITRGKEGLIIFGNAETIVTEDKWNILLLNYMNSGVAVTSDVYQKNLDAKLKLLRQTQIASSANRLNGTQRGADIGRNEPSRGGFGFNSGDNTKYGQRNNKNNSKNQGQSAGQKSNFNRGNNRPNHQKNGKNNNREASHDQYEKKNNRN